MQIRVEQLESHLAKSLAPAYLVHGDEALLSLEAADAVRALVPALEKLKLTDFDRYINVHVSAEPQLESRTGSSCS